jgi:hypothetical protein
MLHNENNCLKTAVADGNSPYLFVAFKTQRGVPASDHSLADGAANTLQHFDYAIPNNSCLF